MSPTHSQDRCRDHCIAASAWHEAWRRADPWRLGGRRPRGRRWRRGPPAAGGGWKVNTNTMHTHTHVRSTTLTARGRSPRGALRTISVKDSRPYNTHSHSQHTRTHTHTHTHKQHTTHTHTHTNRHAYIHTLYGPGAGRPGPWRTRPTSSCGHPAPDTRGMLLTHRC